MEHQQPTALSARLQLCSCLDCASRQRTDWYLALTNHRACDLDL